MLSALDKLAGRLKLYSAALALSLSLALALVLVLGAAAPTLPGLTGRFLTDSFFFVPFLDLALLALFFVAMRFPPIRCEITKLLISKTSGCRPILYRSLHS